MSFDLSRWLRRSPHPASIRVDGDKVVQVGNRGGKWTDMMRTLMVMRPSQLEALASDGSVIRAVGPAELEEDEQQAEPPKGTTTLETFAHLLAGAYEKGSKATQPLLDSMTNYIDKQGHRISGLERQNSELAIENADLRAEVAELQGVVAALQQQPGPEGDVTQQVLAQGLARVLQGPRPRDGSVAKEGVKKP